MGNSLQSTDCCSSLLTALHQWLTVRKKQRYAFLIHFIPGIYKMCCFVGNLFSLFLIAVWDVRKHSDFMPRTVAEFTSQWGWREGFLWPARCSPALAFVYEPFPSPPQAPAQVTMAGKFIATVFGRSLTPDWGFTKQLTYLAGLACLLPEVPNLRSKN